VLYKSFPKSFTYLLILPLLTNNVEVQKYTRQSNTRFVSFIKRLRANMIKAMKNHRYRDKTSFQVTILANILTLPSSIRLLTMTIREHLSCQTMCHMSFIVSLFGPTIHPHAQCGFNNGTAVNVLKNLGSKLTKCLIHEEMLTKNLEEHFISGQPVDLSAICRVIKAFLEHLLCS